MFEKAKAGNQQSISIFEEFAIHLGNAIKMILYTFDVGLIILGGSIRQAWPFYQKKMWEQIKIFSYPKSITNLKIKISELESPGILGAVALYYDSNLS